MALRDPRVRALAVVLVLSPFPLLLTRPLTGQQGFTRSDGETVRILQSNSGGDNIHIIDPATNRVVAEVDGIPLPHGVSYHPDGHVLYASNELHHTLDVISAETLEVVKQIPLSDGPNNIAITPDGRKLYVAIIRGSGGVDVIDTETETNVRHIPTVGGVHNVFATPDGRHVVAGHIGDRTLTVIETATDRPVWSLEFEEGGVRPMEFDVHPDGSTKSIYVEISGWHGFYVVDFEKREVVKRVRIPDLPLSRVDNDALQGSPSHGLARTPDGRTLWVASKPHNSVYAYDLPGHQLVGRVEVGHHPDWLVVTPDSRLLYAANAGSNDVSVVERASLEEVARIPVGHTPKRAHTVVLRGEVPWVEASGSETGDPEPGGRTAPPGDTGADAALRDAPGASRSGAPKGPAPVVDDLDYATYRERVEPILMRDRGGHGPGASACVTCHVASGTPLKLEPLREDADGNVYWTEEASRRNFVTVSSLVQAGAPERSRLLREPLAVEAGGAPFHVGGKFWSDTDDPEWQILAAWVRAAGESAPSAAPDASLAPSFEFFRRCVQRIFLDREEEGDRMECAACHGTGSRAFAQELPEGREFWNLEESRENFGVVMRYVEPGFPMRSRLLTHPLDPGGGGDHYHSGGRRWASTDDPEWRMLAAWVQGKTPACVVEDR